MSSPRYRKAVAAAALRNFEPVEVLELVDQLDLRAQPGQSPLALIPFRSLKQKRNIDAFLDTAPADAIITLLEVLVHEALEEVVEKLGDHAERPSLDQLRAAVDELADDFTPAYLAGTMAVAISGEFPAAPHCRDLLIERPEWGLAEAAASA
jgi:hypothetical protein